MLLDTNAISDLLRCDLKLVDLLGRDDHHFPAIALGEYRFGLVQSTQKDTLSRLLDNWITQWAVLPVGEQTTTYYASIRSRLREKGKPIPENDIWIAALAMQYGLAIASKDKHFDHVSGVTRHSW